MSSQPPTDQPPSTDRLDALYNQVKQAVEDLKTTLQPKLAELGQQVQQKVQEVETRLDQALDELGAAVGRK